MSTCAACNLGFPCNCKTFATPTRTEFEAAALTKDQIISLAVAALPDANPFDTRYEFTETQLCAFVRTAIAAAMGWLTVPEQENNHD